MIRSAAIIGPFWHRRSGPASICHKQKYQLPCRFTWPSQNLSRVRVSDPGPAQLKLQRSAGPLRRPAGPGARAFKGNMTDIQCRRFVPESSVLPGKKN